MLPTLPFDMLGILSGVFSPFTTFFNGDEVAGSDLEVLPTLPFDMPVLMIRPQMMVTARTTASDFILTLFRVAFEMTVSRLRSAR
jgi:hypothetical protein